jgi:ABC-type uncharacterized transport system substrate-binding protein
MHRRRFIASLGSAIAVPRVAAAQQKTIPVIGYLNPTSPAANARNLTGFRQGLSETGYIEGQNLVIEYGWGEGRVDRLPALAAGFVGRKVDVIAASGDAAALAAKSATSTIPIVFFAGGDPVAMGLVASLARPGGNLSGVAFMAAELLPKRLELLLELIPRAEVIALIVNPNDPNAERFVAELQEAASAKGLQLPILKAGTESEINTAFASLAQLHASAVVVSPNAFFASRREQFVAVAASHAVPAVYTGREFPAAGGLISYGASLTNVFRQLGVYAGKILKGAKPADLPVQQPTTFELVVNLSTAKALGLTIPPAILARADEVIE